MIERLYLEHQEFVRRLRANEISCFMDNMTARTLSRKGEVSGCGFMLFEGVIFAIILAAAVLLFVSPVVGVTCLIVGIALNSPLSTAAKSLVLNKAVNDKEFYLKILAANAIKVIAVGQPSAANNPPKG